VIGVAGANRAALWPMIFVVGALSVAVHFGAFSRPEPAAGEVAGPLDAQACEGLMRGLAAAVLADDDAQVRHHLHPSLLARLVSDRPVSAQMRDVLPDAAVLRRFDRARFELRGVGTDAAGVSERVNGQRLARLVVHLSEGPPLPMAVQAAPHDGLWVFLGLGD
jgi:hypothetical protein